MTRAGRWRRRIDTRIVQEGGASDHAGECYSTRERSFYPRLRRDRVARASPRETSQNRRIAVRKPVAQSPPRKHHYLPQFYLRGFSRDGRTLYQIQKATGKAVPGSVRDLAAKRDYHRLDSEKISDQFELERRLADFEGVLAQGLQRVLDYGICDTENHGCIVQLVSLFRCRVPAFKQYVEAMLRSSVRSVGKIMEQKGEFELPPHLEEPLSFDNLSIEISNWICLRFMFLQAVDPGIRQVLASMNHEILEAPSGTEFITCDQPVALFNPRARPSDEYGVGLATPETELSLPLSRDRILRLSWTKEVEPKRVLSSSEVDEFNRRALIMATSYLFCSDDSVLNHDLLAANRERFAGFEPPVVLDTDTGAIQLARVRAVLPAEHYE